MMIYKEHLKTTLLLAIDGIVISATIVIILLFFILVGFVGNKVNEAVSNGKHACNEQTK